MKQLWQKLWSGRNGPKQREKGRPNSGARRKLGRDQWLYLDLDKEFYGLLLGVHSFTEAPLNPLEREVLDELQSISASKLSRTRLVPRLPEVLPLLMRALRDEDAANRDLVTKVERDPVLAGEVVRLANGPLFYRGRKLESLEQAVFVLGRDGLRQLTATVAMRPLFNIESGHFQRLFGRRIWIQAERCAVACRCFTRSEPVDPFEAYLAGLVHNVGFLVGAQVLGRALTGDEAPRSLAFRERFVPKCQWLSFLIAREWALPDSIIRALEDQTAGKAPEQMSSLGAILYWSVELSQIVTLEEEGRFSAEADQIVRWVGARSLSRCDRCYRELKAALERKAD